MDSNKNIEIPVEILEQLKMENVVLFCGAGISMSPDGLPSGGQLSKELAVRANLGDITCMPLPDVAQAYVQELGFNSLIQYVSARIENPLYTPLASHRMIAQLPFKYIISTNWDNLLEQAFQEQSILITKVVKDAEVAFATPDRPLIIKIHGSIEQKDSIVIAGDDYYNVFMRLPAVTNLVRTYFATKTILFMGFGLADEDFRRMYHEVFHQMGRHIRRAYAVQFNPSKFVVRYWQEKNVSVINCDAAEFLSELKAAFDAQI